MRKVRVEYHREDDGWWAESPDVEGWTAVGGSFEEVRDLSLEGLPFFEEEELDIEEVGIPTGAAEIVWKSGPPVLSGVSEGPVGVHLARG